MAGILSILKYKTHHLHQLYHEKGVGSSHGWLIMVDEQTSSLFAINSLKLSARIELPTLLFFPDVLEFDGDDDVYRSVFLDTAKKSLKSVKNNTCVKKVVFSKNPPKEGCVAVGVFGEDKKLGYCKIGDDKCTMMTDQQETDQQETVISAYNLLNSVLWIKPGCRQFALLIP